ncbi:DUF4238 domain-containing protein [Halorubrum sp. CBA1229]|uniref:DUF4238 domain-containing protein n=1 Tax=Halorubrum sp. CBA1229 TaxID=1853699 RepID=UPI000F3D3839|nr:DUF4238 domain-containing protein [Halorubrum sp. CBA1229]QKY18310.1 DUF4238 domain-containing protein [Halorubrum sp. CBA1229]
MTEKKNQHYVPQYVLKPWSDSNDKISCYHLESGRSFNETRRSVCSRGYFYGQKHVEDALGKLDGYHSRPLNEIRRGTPISELSPQHKQLLLSYIGTQRNRTRSEKKDIKSGEDMFWEAAEVDMLAGKYEHMIEWRKEMSQTEKLDALVDASIKGVQHFLMISGILSYGVLGDLDGAILRNATDCDYIISDTPIVHDNPRFKDEKGMRITGMAERGLQIITPIDQRRSLFLYDPIVYGVDTNHRREVIITEPEIVEEINLLQLHNTGDIAMEHTSNSGHISSISHRIEEFRRRDRIEKEIGGDNLPSWEISSEDSHQTPLKSPDLPGVNSKSGVRYTDTRNEELLRQTKQMSRYAMKISDEASDVALIGAIRFLESNLGLNS